MAYLMTAFFLQATDVAPVTLSGIIGFLMEILRYLLGVGFVALAGACGKLWKDNIDLKNDVATLKDQRKCDVIERNDIKTIAQAIKHESMNLKTEFDSKLKDVMHHFALQQKEDRDMMKGMFYEVNITLTKLNSTIEYLQEKNKQA